ncbi:hypothetical protein AMECASPLE_013705 [Ameca splendens]|uniref:Uncharacterized protein n=1 Tax=Ameca splendens TaxID=208324 RepID=A0ABV0YNN5_9TELE
MDWNLDLVSTLTIVACRFYKQDADPRTIQECENSLGVLAIVHELAGRIPIANNDKIQHSPLGPLTGLHAEIIFRKFGMKIC